MIVVVVAAPKCSWIHCSYCVVAPESAVVHFAHIDWISVRIDWISMLVLGIDMIDWMSVGIGYWYDRFDECWCWCWVLIWSIRWVEINANVVELISWCQCKCGWVNQLVLMLRLRMWLNRLVGVDVNVELNRLVGVDVEWSWTDWLMSMSSRVVFEIWVVVSVEIEVKLCLMSSWMNGLLLLSSWIKVLLDCCCYRVE